MKIKQTIVITDPDVFLRTNYTSGMNLFDSNRNLPKEWIVCGEIDLDIDVNINDITLTVINTINEAMKAETAKHASRMCSLETRKQELLALPWTGAA